MGRLTLGVLLLAAFSFSGCAHINGVMRSWEGQHYAQLIERWGPPQQVFDDGADGRILVYTTDRAWVVPGTARTTTTFNATAYDNLIWGTATSRTVYTPAQLQGYTAYRMFWIDRSGHIYRWAWQGL
jgi:hypothetical protein